MLHLIAYLIILQILANFSFKSTLQSRFRAYSPLYFFGGMKRGLIRMQFFVCFKTRTGKLFLNFFYDILRVRIKCASNYYVYSLEHGIPFYLFGSSINILFLVFCVAEKIRDN